MNAMRETGSNGSGVQISSQAVKRVLRLAAVLLGVGLVFGSGVARAQEDADEDDRTFERKIIDNLMGGLGAKRLEDGGINYRERSPLVVPSKIDLPPPVTGKRALAPNWPKDPDEAERKAMREAAKVKEKSPEEQRVPLMPNELAAKKPRGRTASADSANPGNNSPASAVMMMPSDLGYVGGILSNPFSTKTESEKFTSEPERSDLTQPPGGYQTPSPNYAYGVGQLKAPKEICDMSSGKCEKSYE
jgi:hypothetical protein